MSKQSNIDLEKNNIILDNLQYSKTLPDKDSIDAENNLEKKNAFLNYFKNTKKVENIDNIISQKNLEQKIFFNYLHYARKAQKPERTLIPMETNELIYNNSNEFINHIREKIIHLQDSQLFLEFKLLDTKNNFRKFNFIVLFNTVLLTFIEILYKQFDVINSSQVIGTTAKNILLLLPFVLTSIITLLSAWIKSLKFEEVIENITRGIEKSITAKSKFTKINEDIYLINLNVDNDSNVKFNDIISTKYKNALKDYLDALTIIDKNSSAKDFQKFLSDYIEIKEKEADFENAKKNIDIKKYEYYIYIKKKELASKKDEIELNNEFKKIEKENNAK